MATSDRPVSELEQWIERLFSLLTVRRVMFLMLGVLLYIAWNRGIALIYVLLFFLLAVLIVSYAVSFSQVSPISVRRTHPAIANEGQTLTLHYEVSSNARLARNMLEIFDALPFAVPAAQQPMLFVAKAQDPATLSFTTLADWRGLHSLGPLRVESGWPFGLFRSHKILDESSSEILVYPSTFPIRQLPLSGYSSLRHTGWACDQRKGGQDLFLGIRDYRRGDSLRHIHWALSARHGELMVKEFENINRTEICILMDLNRQHNPGEGKHTPLEYAVKIAASIAGFALKEGHFVSLYGLGKTPLEIDAGHGPLWLDKILYALALVKADGGETYDSLIKREISGRGQHCLFLLFDHQGLHLQPGNYGLNAMQTLLVRFDPKTFGQQPPTHGRTPGDGSLMVRCGDDLEEQVQLWTGR